MPNDNDNIADLRVLIAEVGGDVKAVLAKLDDQKRRIAVSEGRIKEHDTQIGQILGRLNRWAGAAALVVGLFSSGFVYLLYMILNHTP